jgi:hypothetical protein
MGRVEGVMGWAGLGLEGWSLCKESCCNAGCFISVQVCSLFGRWYLEASRVYRVPRIVGKVIFSNNLFLPLDQDCAQQTSLPDIPSLCGCHTLACSVTRAVFGTDVDGGKFYTC